MLRKLVIGSLFALTLSVGVFADSGAAEPPRPARPDGQTACSVPASNPNEQTLTAGIDEYGACVYKCLKRKGTNPDYCAQSCAGLLQNLQQEKRPVDEDLAKPVVGE